LRDSAEILEARLFAMDSSKVDTNTDTDAEIEKETEIAETATTLRTIATQFDNMRLLILQVIVKILQPSGSTRDTNHISTLSLGAEYFG